MSRRFSISGLFLLMLTLIASPVYADLPQISTGLSYLSSTQNPDGTWQTVTAQVETTAATVSVLETLKLLNQTAGTPYTTGVSWLQAQSPLSVDYIAERLHALGLSDVNALIPSVDSSKGGWGGDTGYETNILDTSLALQALKPANNADLTIIDHALAYLTTSQNPDGGWGFYKGDPSTGSGQAASNVYMTAVVSATLQQFPQMTTIATAVSKATAYLLAHQNPDGGFGSSPSTVYETALAYAALAAVTTNEAALGSAVTYLTAVQSANGSWNDDPYSTALALKALHLSENRPSPPPAPPAGGKITGIVVDKVTSQRLGGVSVVLDSNQMINTVTDASGNFTLADIPAGTQKVNFSLTGYAAASASTGVVESTTASLGSVQLVSDYSTGTIAGTISDDTGKPLADVAIAVSGAWSGSTTTGADGSYSFTYVTPGNVTITVAKTGYQAVTGPGTVYARTTLSFSPRLSTTPPQATTGTLVGRVVDSYWGVPIGHLPEETGVQVIVSGRTPVAVEPEGGGYFTVPNLAPNTYQVTVGMNGFTTRTVRAVVMPGVTTDLGTIRLEMSFLMALTGKVTDATTGAPIPGAEVTIQGTDFTGRADFAGTYGIVDIPHPAEYTVRASATGYIGKSYTMGSAPWAHTMDFSLSPQVTKGSLTGTVVDVATSQPLAGVTLTLVSDPPLTATSDSAGAFTFAAVPQGQQQVTLALNGYTTRTLTTAITAGAVNNVGVIPLSVTTLPASIRGTVWDAIANAPFAGVGIQATGAAPLQTDTGTDGTYTLDNVEPGPVTVATATVPKPGYGSARFTGVLEPGGILVFNPALSTQLPGTVDIAVQTDKLVYLIGDTVGMSITLRNREAMDSVVTLWVRITDPSGTNAYEASVIVNLAADGASDQPLSFVLPAFAQWGGYMVIADVYGANGALLKNAVKGFAVAVSQIAVTPTLPARFSTGDNAVSFNLTNTGTLAVSTGVLGVTLKDPDGQVVATGNQPFSLGLGKSKALTLTVTTPTLRFGTYTLSYVQSDETKTGQVTDIPLPNTLTVTGLYDDASHRVRNTATLTVILSNTGRFNLDNGATSQGIAVTAAVPDAAYAETKTLSAVPVTGSTLLYSFPLPETMIAGQHGTRITVTLPSGSALVQSVQLAIQESALSLAPVQTAQVAGGVIQPVFANSGGVDTSVQYRLSLYDAKSALITENSNTETAVAGSTLTLGLAIPAGAVDGNYNLVVNYKDLKTGKEGMVPNAVTISGVKGALQVRTSKPNYLLTENIAGSSSMTSSGTPLTGGNLHLQVTTGPGAQRMKTWTTQADFQTGVRNGVDTYGVNDWIIPDDDFSGTTIDTNKWWTGGTVSIQAGKLILDTMQATVSSTVTSKWLLEGDFDIQVDFMSNNSTSWTGAGFGVSCGNNTNVGLGNYMAPGYASQNTINGVQQPYIYNGISANSGKFRVTRTSNIFVVYYWGGASWVEFSRATSSAFTAPCSVGMGIYRDPAYPGANTAFDNLKVNSGRIKTENQTTNSVRLLPLNDNFDDGVLNLDRWAAYGTVPIESAGLLHIVAPPSPAYSSSGVYLRYNLLGDFAANTKFSNYSYTGDARTGGQDLAEVVNLGATFVGTKAGFGIGRGSSDPSFASGEFIISWRYFDNTMYDSWFVSRTPYSSNSGMMRLGRSGTTVTTDFWNGFAWTNIISQNSMPIAPALLRLYAEIDANPQMPGVQSDIHHFFTNAGTYANNGTISLKHDAGAANNIWGKLLYGCSQPAGTSIKFRTRTAETEAGLATATWSDYLTASGSPVNSPAARWIEIESTLSTTDTNVTPLLHDVTVTYESNPGEILWQTDLPATLAQGAPSDLNSTIGTLGMTGKFYLEGTLTSSTGQSVATAEYSFYVEQGNLLVLLAPDKKIYRPGETVTITGEVKNLSSIAATGLTTRLQGTGVVTPYAETFDLPANSAHPFSFTTTAGSNGIYQLTATVTQNSAPLADIADQYEVATPALTASLTAPNTVANEPFTISVSLNNTGKVSATTTVHVVDDSGNVIGDQAVTVAVGESRILQYTRQITGATTFSAVMRGDLDQTLTKSVAYVLMPTDNTVSGRIVTDKASYNPNEPVMLTPTLSAGTIRENLSALVTVTNSQGQALYSATAAIPIVIPGQTITINKQWNTGTSPAGAYLATLQVLDAAGTVIAKATFNLVINSTTRPAALLKGQISVDRQNILTGEPVAVSYGVTNTGNVDLSDIALSVRTIHTIDQTVYDTIADQALLAMGGSYTNSGLIDTRSYSAKDYLVVLLASIDGVEETLAGTYFRVEGAPSAPALSGPAIGTDLDSFTPLLSVSNAADPNDDRLTYEFEIYADSGLTNLVASGTVSETTGTTAWTVPVPLTENQTWYWRARAHDGRLYGPWMAPASFRVNTVDDPPAAPNITSPADGTAVAVLTPVLTVNNAADPDSTDLTYNFDLALDPDFIQIVSSAKGITGGAGTTSWAVPVSLAENGWYYWRAQADDWLMEGPWSTAARFLVNTLNDAPSTPVIATPANDSTVAALAIDAAVTNSIDPDSPTLSYYFEADTVPTFDSTGIIRSGSVPAGEGTTHWHLSGLKDNTRYYLRVRASDGTADSPWSEVTSFVANTVNDPPTTPMLANPSSGAGVNLSAPTLSVHNAMDLDKDILTYRFEVYADAAMTNLVAQSGSITEAPSITGWTIPVTLAENQTYYWQARSFDGSLYSGWMPVASFMINTVNDAPGPPSASEPADGSGVATLTPTLAITNAIDPDSDTVTYEFEIYADTTLVASAAGVPGNGSGTTAWMPGSPLADNTIYQWRARAFDGDRYGQWMNMATFTTHVPVTSIKAEIEFEPETLNRKSQGTWVKVEIELPHGYRAADIDIASIRLEGTVPAEAWPHRIRHGEHEDELTVKFRRSDVIAVLPEGTNVPVHLTGNVGSTPFEGVDIIRVIEK